MSQSCWTRPGGGKKQSNPLLTFPPLSSDLAKSADELCPLSMCSFSTYLRIAKIIRRRFCRFIYNVCANNFDQNLFLCYSKLLFATLIVFLCTYPCQQLCPIKEAKEGETRTWTRHLKSQYQSSQLVLAVWWSLAFTCISHLKQSYFQKRDIAMLSIKLERSLPHILSWYIKPGLTKRFLVSVVIMTLIIYLNRP